MHDVVLCEAYANQYQTRRRRRRRHHCFHHCQRHEKWPEHHWERREGNVEETLVMGHVIEGIEKDPLGKKEVVEEKVIELVDVLSLSLSSSSPSSCSPMAEGLVDAFDEVLKSRSLNIDFDHGRSSKGYPRIAGMHCLQTIEDEMRRWTTL